MNEFDKWNKIKQKIHNKWQKQFYVKQREIWYINLWINIWDEENWKNNDFRVY